MTQHTTQELALAMSAKLLDATQILSMEPPEWLVEDMLPADGLGVLFGKPGSYKTFLALDLACCVAAGAPFLNDHGTKRGKVLYIAAEGRSGLGLRLEAWMTRFRVPELPDFHLYPQAIPLADERYGPALVELCRLLKPKLVVIDTLARSMAGGDENSTRDMGKLMDTIDRVRQASGSMVLLVHHTTKGGDAYRGNSSLEGAMDTMLQLSKEDATGLLTLSCFKQKDGMEFRDKMLHAETVTIRGGLTTSCVLLSPTGVAKVQARASTESSILATFATAPPGTELSAKQLSDITGAAYRTIYRALGSLVKEGFLLQTKEGYGARYALNPARRAELSPEIRHDSPPSGPSREDSPPTPGARRAPGGESPKAPPDDDSDEGGQISLECP